MARISFNHPYINVELPSVDLATGVNNSTPQYKPGMEIRCDSGVYRYLQATTGTSAGHMCKVILNGHLTSNYNATTVLTADSGTVQTDLGVCVSPSGMVANQWGWFWLGEGEEKVYLASALESTSGVGATWTTRGEVANARSGDVIMQLAAIDSNTSSGLRLCRSATRLHTNPNTSVG